MLAQTSAAIARLDLCLELQQELATDTIFSSIYPSSRCSSPWLLPTQHGLKYPFPHDLRTIIWGFTPPIAWDKAISGVISWSKNMCPIGDRVVEEVDQLHFVWRSVPNAWWFWWNILLSSSATAHVGHVFFWQWHGHWRNRFVECWRNRNWMLDIGSSLKTCLNYGTCLELLVCCVEQNA